MENQRMEPTYLEVEFINALSRLLLNQSCDNNHELTYIAGEEVGLSTGSLVRLESENCCACEVVLNIGGENLHIYHKENGKVLGE